MQWYIIIIIMIFNIKFLIFFIINLDPYNNHTLLINTFEFLKNLIDLHIFLYLIIYQHLIVNLLHHVRHYII
jgi:hypothetical protein